MSKSTKAKLLLQIAATLLPLTAGAAPIEIFFSGTIDYSQIAAIPENTAYSGEITYDSSDLLTPVTTNNGFGYGGYLSGASEGLFVNVGSFQISVVGGSETEISVGYNTGGPSGSGYDILGVNSYAPEGSSTLPGSPTPSFVNLNIDGNPGLLQVSPNLPSNLNLPDLYTGAVNGVTYSGFYVEFPGTPNGLFLDGGLNSVQVKELTAAPEPSTPTLIAPAMLIVVFGFRQLRRDRRADHFGADG